MELAYDLKKKSRDVKNVEKDLKYSRSGFVTWGKEIIFAIDADHAGRLIYTLKSKQHLGADMDAVTTRSGYGGYAWTVYMHKFLGICNCHTWRVSISFICGDLLDGRRCSGSGGPFFFDH